VPVREEIRRNVLARIIEGRPVVEGVLGFEDTVVPQLEHALLAGHDVILLGERGQAKSRIIRSLVELLDEWLPKIAGSEINDDPFHPVSRYARDLVSDVGDETPVSWVHRSDRYGEKLATPDTSIADLIGEVDPIKVAEGRYLSDELTIHYGLVPRCNRGIFAVNELPDLAERIQVGLLNVLEERDVQIRGYRVRLPLDVLLVASANPDDYTSRGRIITPLKDRFGAQIRTHYPLDVATEMAIVAQEARPVRIEGITVEMPSFMAEIVSRLSQLARESARVNQRSGVSVRLSVANHETLVAAALRRALRGHEREAVPRVSDLESLLASTLGKIEVESLEEGDDAEIVGQLLHAAVLQTFRDHVPAARLPEVVGAFGPQAGGDEHVAEVGSDVPAAGYERLLGEMASLNEVVAEIAGDGASLGLRSSAAELVLEGLHLSRRLNKDQTGGHASFRARARGER
jgi:magnesium chelatase subunit I